MKPASSNSNGISRRVFVGAVAASGAGAAIGMRMCSQPTPSNPASVNRSATATLASTQPATTQAERKTPTVNLTVDPINIALIGVGKQGKILLDDMLKIRGVKVKAICDIWSYGRKLGLGMANSAKQNPNIYDDYREMLAKENGIEAVFVATPDFCHAPITNDCLRAGKHVYCEKEMSNTIEGAASMVRTQRETGKLLQIGHQRRSNPFYLHALEMIQKNKFLGTIYTINGQWNQFKELRALPPVMVKKYPMPQELLNKWGYDSYEQFYEWRWFNKYAGGPMTDLGSHQIDIYNWFLNAYPTRVTAYGGLQRALADAEKGKVGFVPECFDHTVCQYEWKLPDRTVLGHYQVSLNTSSGKFYESFEGTGGTIVTSELIDKMAMFRERTGVKAEWVDEAAKAAEAAGRADGSLILDPLASRKAQGNLSKEELAAMENDLAVAGDWPHLPHIHNFINAIQGRLTKDKKKEQLNCPAEEAYATAVSVIKANEAARTGRSIEFKPEDFKVL